MVQEETVAVSMDHPAGARNLAEAWFRLAEAAALENLASPALLPEQALPWKGLGIETPSHNRSASLRNDERPTENLAV